MTRRPMQAPRGRHRETGGSRRRGALAVAAAGLIWVSMAPLAAPAVAETQLIADATARSFTLRPAYDAGGSVPLNFYIGYSEANASTPEPAADGQASWYNLGIAETALFQEPENCTPEKNVEATVAGFADLQAYAADYVASAAQALSEGKQPPTPGVPSFHHACTERLPGFAQSRYPSTASCFEGRCGGIPESSRDDLNTKLACRDTNACAAWGELAPLLAPVAAAGSFSSVSTASPSNESEEILTGIGDGVALRIGAGATRASARLAGDVLTVTARTSVSDICIGRTPAGCSVHIDGLGQQAMVIHKRGRKPVASARTVITGVSVLASGVDIPVIELSDKDLNLDALSLPLGSAGGELFVQAVGPTNDCTPAQNAASYAIADTGGITITGKMEGAGAGAIMIGGACARARLASFDLPEFALPAAPGTPRVLGNRVEAPGAIPPVAVAPHPAPAYRVVTREVVRYATVSAPAWRWAPWWGSILGAMIALSLAGYRFRSTRLVRPAATSLDRFTRAFLKG